MYGTSFSDIIYTSYKPLKQPSSLVHPVACR